MRFVKPSHAHLLALLPLLAACTPSLRAGGALRMEQLQAEATPAQQQLRADARASLALRGDAGTLGVTLSPTVVLPTGEGAAPRTVILTELSAAGDLRSRIQPRLLLAAERGRTRSVELGSEPLDPRSSLVTATTERVAASTSLRFRQSARREFSIQADVSRNGGIGADANALPQLQRAALGIERRTTIGERRGLVLRFGGESIQRQSDAAWTSLRADAEWSRALRRRDQLSFGVGVVQGLDSTGADIRLKLGWRHSARRGGLGWEAALEQAPELDRLDGRLRTRRRARLSLESARVSGVSFRGSLQGLADAATANARRGLGAELGLRQPLSTFATLEADVAHVLLWEGQATQRSESRAAVGIRIPLR